MITKFIDVTGKTEDEAVASALAQLGLERDDVSVEILERAKKGFLGIGASPAKCSRPAGEVSWRLQGWCVLPGTFARGR